MKGFEVYQIGPHHWSIEVDGFNFDVLPFDTMNQITDFLLSLGYKEILRREVGEE